MHRNPLRHLHIIVLIFSVVSALSIFSSCHRDSNDDLPPNPTDTTQPTPPPPPPQDTISLVRRLEEDFDQANPKITRRNRNYSFYYDGLKRVSKIGIKNFGPVQFDTATTSLFYSNNSSKPYMIITPNVERSPKGQAVNYDTTYFTYNVSNQITSDSSLDYIYNFATSSYIKRPLKRIYSYPSGTKTVVEWYGHYNTTGPLEIIRIDTLYHLNNYQFDKLRTQFYISQTPGNYALGEAFTYSNITNPLSKLNIGGSVFSLIYTPVKHEILGNRYHKAVHNSNILPYYLDFFSPKIPFSFYLGGFTNGGFLISAQYDRFIIDIVPWNQRNTYPSQISVGASTALGDKFIYRYFY